MAQQVTIETAYNVELNFYVADPMDRVWAHLIDMIIKIGYLILIFAIFDITGGFHFFHLFLSLPYMFYSVLFELLNNGQTPGKKAVELQVVSLDGKNLRAGQLMIRWFLRLVDFMFFSAGVGLLAVMSTRKGQRVGDIIADTAVITLKKQHDIRKTSRVKLPKGFVGTNRDVLKLNEEEVELLKEVIRNREASAFKTQKEAALKISEYLDIPIEENQKSKKYLKDIVYQYNYFHMIDDGLITPEAQPKAELQSQDNPSPNPIPEAAKEILAKDSSEILRGIPNFDISDIVNPTDSIKSEEE